MPARVNAQGHTAAPRASAPWIGGKRYDLVFFFGSGLVAALAGAVALMAPVLLVPMVWAWLWLIEGPHLLATWQRTYLDPDERQGRKRLLLGSLFFILPGIGAWALGLVSGSNVPLELLLLAGALASWHHGVRQHYGIMAVYEAQARTPAWLWRLDKLAMHGGLWAAFALSLVAIGANRRILELPEPVPAWARASGILAAILCGAAVLALAGSLVLRLRQGLSPRPCLFALLPVMGVLGFALFVVGAFEPIVAHPANDEQAVLAVSLVGGVVHGLQYIGIVLATNQRRYAARARPSLAARLGRAPLLSYAALALASLLYVALNAARGTMPAAALFGQDSGAAGFFVGLYWGLFFHHYYLDQKIWRIRSDPRLRTELGLA